MNISTRSWKTQTLLMVTVPLILAALTLAIYYPSLSYEFQFDDIVNIKKYFHARTSNFSSLAFTNPRWISFWINTVAYRFVKHDPFYYRLLNVIIHVLSGLLVYLFVIVGLSRIARTSYFYRRRLILATVTALLFFLHPVQTQTVSYVIQGQLEGLATLFVMTILCLFLASTKTANSLVRTVLYSLLVLIGYLSTGTKEIAIVGPLLLLMTDWFFVAQGSFKDLKSRWFVHVLYTLCIAWGYYGFLRKNVTVIDAFKGTATLNNNVGNVITTAPGQVIKVSDFFISQFKVILHYMGMFLWPFNISVDYDWKMSTSFFSPDCFGPFLVLCLLGAGIIYLLYRNKQSLVAFGALWFFVCLAPRSSFIPSTELVADYKTYLASVGYLFILALALSYAFEKVVQWCVTSTRTRTVYSSGAVTLCALCLCIMTHQRNTVWRSGEEFWYNIIQTSPKKARAYNNYAVALAEKCRYQEAIPYLRKAIKIDRQYPDPWNNISVCYNHLGKVDLAINTMEEALKINPTYPEFYNNLASYFLTKKEYERSIVFAQEAIKRRPYYGKPYFNWGRCLHALGKSEEALEYIRKACIECDYDTVEGTSHYAQLAMQMSKYNHAIEALEQLHRMMPQHSDTIFNLATAYYFAEQYEKSASVFEHLATNYPNEERSWFNLGECHARLNNVKQALAAYERALPLEPQFPQVKMRIAECQKALTNVA